MKTEFTNTVTFVALDRSYVLQVRTGFWLYNGNGSPLRSRTKAGDRFRTYKTQAEAIDALLTRH